MRWFKQLFSHTPTLYHVSDNADWVLQWVAHYVSEEVTRHGTDSAVITSPWHLRRQMIHFHDRYVYFQNAHRVHSSNGVFLTWLHGNPHEAEFAAMGKNLFAALPTLEKIVTSCRITERYLLDAGVPPEKLVLIPLGVDTQTFVPPPDGAREAVREKLGIPQDAFCIGSFQKDGNGWGDGDEPKLIKGPDVLVDTLTTLAERHSNLFVLLTGPARGFVKRGLERAGIPYVHHFLSHYPDVVSYYHALDAYLITSRAEGGPIGLMESWCTGVPVVSTQMGMPADWIRHDENGLLAPVDDVSALVAQTERLINNRDFGVRLAQQARQDVLALDWRVLARQYYEQLYQPYLWPTPHA